MRSHQILTPSGIPAHPPCSPTHANTAPLHPEYAPKTCAHAVCFDITYPNAFRMEMLIGTPIVTNTPTPSPTFAPCAVAAPTNGALGTCASSLAAGASCQFSCNNGYGVSGPTSCSSSTGLLAAATCRTGVWTTRKAVPAMSYMPAQGAGAYDTFMYTYIAGPGSMLNRGEFYKYASTADTWTTGGTNPP
jgi:hypothetical protein